MSKHIIRALSAIAFIYLLGLALDHHLKIFDTPVKQLANLLPAIAALGLFYGLTRRLWTSAALTAGTLGLIFAAHHLKIEHLHQSLKFADTFLAWQTVTNWNLLSLYAPTWLIPVIAIGITFIVAIAYWEKADRWLIGAPILVAALLCFIGISHKQYSPNSLYGPHAHGAKPWDTQSKTQAQGLLAAITSGARSAQIHLPEVDRQTLDSFLAKSPPRTPITNEAKPDIVVWLAESFFDPGILHDIKTCEYLPEYCSLLNESLHTSLEVPTFGGNTTRTEFEVLTSTPFHALGTKDYPYVSVVHHNMSSIVWSLKALGYQTTAIHPNHASMWQRDRAMPLLGFDKFISRADFDKPELDGVWVSDAELLRRIQTTLAASDTPQLVFAISMEGHGPFPKREVVDLQRRDAVKVPEGTNTKAATQWREYIYHAQNAGRAVHHLKSAIEQKEQPTLVVFFGDHLPNLKHLFKQRTFKNGKPAWQQKTPALAFANYPLNVSWLPKATYELGVWSLALAGLVEHTKYHYLAHAIELSQQEESNDELAPVIEALQIDNLYTTIEASP
ncbi:LTA synthase family protein [Gilvimarinus xylanilyticus]|uniref:LTA synthase family protein n=1 Tax=Gilvimarinus xylanilyticus TaxID=2944139 RepID=A0A9X2KX08_9GAMM|nr:LTA synthase family protein [Gilvimarinus xylanilyticus]MCP8900165.1 LTA synthase family protein [Gilvimarinus xylanilyticus]